VRAEDAEAFCEWLTRRQGGEVIYRLPNLDEAADDTVTKGKIAFWLRAKDGFYLDGMAKAVEQDYQHQLESLCRVASLTWKPQPLRITIPDENDLTNILKVASSGALTFTLDLHLAVFRLIVQITYFYISHVRDLARSLDLALALALARDLDLDLARALDLARDLDRALALDLDLALDRARALDRDLDLDRDLALARDLARDLDLAPARALALARDLDLALARALARARNLDRALDLDLALDRARARNLDLDLDLDRDLDRARTLVQAITRVLVIVYVYSNNLNNALDRSLNGHLYELLSAEINRLDAASKNEFVDISRLLQDLQKDSAYLPRSVQQLLPYILASVSAFTPFDSRHSQRWFVARMLEIALTNNQTQLQRRTPRWWRRLWQRHTAADLKQAHELDAQFYSWLQIVIAREEGKLQAWEGIRIVRELAE
jgi:hypothetical protein